VTPLPAQFIEWLRACNDRFARFSGSRFSAHEVPSGTNGLIAIKRLCLDCGKREVKLRQKYCRMCSKTRIRQSKRRHMARKRGLDVEKLANSPTGAEALTNPELQPGYDDTQTPISESSFSTHPPIPHDTSEAHTKRDHSGRSR
jgi:hypothetical protein